jgi:hypothetical protein
MSEPELISVEQNTPLGTVWRCWFGNMHFCMYPDWISDSSGLRAACTRSGSCSALVCTPRCTHMSASMLTLCWATYWQLGTYEP